MSEERSRNRQHPAWLSPLYVDGVARYVGIATLCVLGVAFLFFVGALVARLMLGLFIPTAAFGVPATLLVAFTLILRAVLRQPQVQHEAKEAEQVAK